MECRLSEPWPLFAAFDRHFDYSVLPVFEKAISLVDTAQWKTVRNKRHGVDPALFDQA